MMCESMRLGRRIRFTLLAFLFIVSSATGRSASAAEDPIEFNRDIRPILSDKCFFCHGPDKHERQAEMRLDQEEEAIRRVDGDYIIRRGRPNESMVYQRITDTDVDVRMPPVDSGKTLSDAEIALIKRWIEEGAKWQKHWAFIPPKRPALPKVSNESWPRNAINHFILARLDREGLKPSRRATKETLIRRLSFDLTGLPPTIEEIDRFLADKSPQAYERVVEHYLNSERYGEHMARFWLDAARYADSNGYEYDQSRLMWPWREWVIRAYNKNQPFDAFTADQLAGDLMTNPDDFQLTASGFNRNHPISVEGGIIDEEYRTEYAVDCVVTTTSVWLGLTFTCARCHDHKFDPISQKDFYQLFAFFNQIPESGNGHDDSFAPVQSVMTEGLRKQANALQKRVTELKSQFRKDTPELRSAQKRWASKLREPVTWNYVDSNLRTSDNGTILTSVGTSSVLASQPADGPEIYTATLDTGPKQITALRLEAAPHESLPAGGLGLAENGWFALSKIRVTVVPPGVTRLAGRYLRVEIFGEKKLITLAEVQAFDDAGENVALGSKATQSSTGWGGLPERANDGNTSPNYGDGSQSHAEIQKDPWFEIDLGSTRSLSSLVIWNRNEHGLHTELNGAVYTVLDEDRNVVWKESVAEASKEPQEFSLLGEAVRKLPILDQWNLDFAEQPIPTEPMENVLELQRRTPVPLSGNEAMWRRADAWNVIHKRAYEVVCFSSYFVGTLGEFHRICHAADAAGMLVCRHTHGELGLTAAAHHHVLLNLPSIVDGNQQTAHLMVDDILTEPLPIATGPDWGVIDGPGLGVEVDEEKVEKYHQQYLEHGQIMPYDLEKIRQQRV